MAKGPKQTTERATPAGTAEDAGAAGPAGPSRREPSGRRAELVAIAADRFARDGYASTTVRDIADAAGILSGSLYHHFTSKEAIADAILTPFLGGLLARYDEIAGAGLPPRETVEALMTATLEAGERDPAAVLVHQADGARLASHERLAHLRGADERIDAIWSGAIARGVAAGEFRGSVDPQVAARVIRVALWAVPSWRAPGTSPSLAELTEQHLGILLDGISKGKRKKRTN